MSSRKLSGFGRLSLSSSALLCLSNSAEYNCFYFKHSTKCDLKLPISEYILKEHGPERLSDAREYLDALNQKRMKVLAVVDAEPNGDADKEVFATYYRSLCALERLPTADSDEPKIILSFSWTNSTSARRVYTKGDIHLEKAAILFNLAALLSQQAIQTSNESHSDKQGVAVARLFQESASVFSELRRVAAKIGNPKPSDLSPESLEIAETLMLTQAQECVVWTAIKDKKQASVVAQCAKRGSLMYADVLRQLNGLPTGTVADRSWKPTMERKSWLLDAICQHYSAIHARQSNEIGMEIPRLEQTASILEKLRNKGFASEHLNQFVHRLDSITTERIQNAKADNDSVYLQKILPFAALPVVKGFQAVKTSACPYLDATDETLLSDFAA